MRDSIVLYIIAAIFTGIMSFAALTDIGMASMFIVTNIWVAAGWVTSAIEDKGNR